MSNNAHGAGPALTAREREILRGVIRGQTNSQIASSLGTSPHTVKNQLSALYRKANVSNRIGLVAWAYRHGCGLAEA